MHTGLMFFQRRSETHSNFSRLKKFFDPLALLGAFLLGALNLGWLLTDNPTLLTLANLALIAFGPLFLVELVMLYRLVDHKWLYLRNHLVDVLVIVLATVVLLTNGGSSLRLLLLALLLLKSIGEVTTFFAHSKTIQICLVAVLLIVSLGAVVSMIERDNPTSNIESLEDGIWWATVTATTVGYGDHYPTTNLGKVVSIFLFGVGIAVVSTFISEVNLLFRHEADDRQERANTVNMVMQMLTLFDASEDNDFYGEMMNLFGDRIKAIVACAQDHQERTGVIKYDPNDVLILNEDLSLWLAQKRLHI